MDEPYRGRNWFDEGIITHISPTLVRRLSVCEVREEFRRNFRESRKGEKRKNEIFMPKDPPGVVFHNSLFMTLIGQRVEEVEVRPELEFLPVTIDGRYCQSSVDRIDFSPLSPDSPRNGSVHPQTHRPLRIFEYKSGRSEHKVYDSDRDQILTVGLHLSTMGYDTSEMSCLVVLADYGCAPCPKVFVNTESKEYQCDKSLCQGKNRLTAFQFPFDKEEALRVVRDRLDYLEGRRPPRGSTSKPLCDNCYYRPDCSYRVRANRPSPDNVR